MNNFKNVKAWIGEDGYIHLNVVVSGILRNGKEAECEIHDATLPLHPECTISRTGETFFFGFNTKEHFYLKLDDDCLHLNEVSDGIAYTTRILPRKMTKAQIEEALGHPIEIIPDESEKERKND